MLTKLLLLSLFALGALGGGLAGRLPLSGATALAGAAMPPAGFLIGRVFC